METGYISCAIILFLMLVQLAHQYDGQVVTFDTVNLKEIRLYEVSEYSNLLPLICIKLFTLFF